MIKKEWLLKKWKAIFAKKQEKEIVKPPNIQPAVFLKCHLAFIPNTVTEEEWDLTPDESKTKKMDLFKGRVLIAGKHDIVKYYECEPGIVMICSVNGFTRVSEPLSKIDKILIDFDKAVLV